MGKWINVGRGELSCWYLGFEEKIDLGVCSTLEFWDPEVGPDGTEETDSTPV